MEHYVRFSSFGENRVKVDRPTCWLSIICRKTFFFVMYYPSSEIAVVSRLLRFKQSARLRATVGRVRSHSDRSFQLVGQ